MGGGGGMEGERLTGGQGGGPMIAARLHMFIKSSPGSVSSSYENTIMLFRLVSDFMGILFISF